MKKLSLLFLIVIMVFAFVSCSPESSSSPADTDTSESSSSPADTDTSESSSSPADTDTSESNLLPGEVIPPDESERVSATDEEIKKARSMIYVNTQSKRTHCIEEVEVDFGENGKLYVTCETETGAAKERTYNGELTINGVNYKLTDLKYEFDEKSMDSWQKKSGTLMKNGIEQADKNIEDFFKSDEFNYLKPEKRVSEETETWYDLEVLDENEKTIGTGTRTEVTITTADYKNYTVSSSLVLVYDYKVYKDRLQMKMTSPIEKDGPGTSMMNPIIDYIAVNGKFYDEDSANKIMNPF